MLAALGPQVDGVRRAGDGRRDPPHLLHRRRARPLRRARASWRGASGPRPGVGAGVVGAGRAVRPARGGPAARSSSAAWAPTSRATATCSSGSTTGIPRCSNGSAPTTSVASVGGAIDAKADRDQLEHIATLIPGEWLAASAVGSPDACAQRLHDQFAAGADGVVMHAGTPEQLAPAVEAYRGTRDPSGSRAAAEPRTLTPDADRSHPSRARWPAPSDGRQAPGRSGIGR